MQEKRRQPGEDVSGAQTGWLGGTEEQGHGTQRAEAGPEEGPKGRDETQRLYRVLDKERRRRGAERTGGAQAEAKPRGQGLGRGQPWRGPGSLFWQAGGAALQDRSHWQVRMSEPSSSYPGSHW